jgi:Protein of unknown function (DUF3131)
MKPLRRANQGGARARWAALALLQIVGFLISLAGTAAAQVLPASTLLGWEALRNNRPLAAGDAWLQAAAQASQRRNAAGLRDAAFANVLATIAYERGNDERAYARWAESTRQYLEAGLTWERAREELAARWRRLERDLNQAPAGVPPTLGPEDQMLADLVGRVNLLAFKGPRTGLQDSRAEAANVNVITPQYFAGASRTESETDATASQSRYGALAIPTVAAAGSLSLGPKGEAASLAPPTTPSPESPPNSAAAVADNTPALTRSQQAALNAAARAAAMGAAQAVRATPAAFATGAATTTPTPQQGQAATAAAEPVTQQVVRHRPSLDDQARAFTSSAMALASTGMPRLFVPSGKAHTLTPAERSKAQLAWRYVMANRQSATGLVNGKDSYPVASVADIAQAIAAYHAALALQFIERDGFEADMRQLLATLRELPLYRSELFNREYDTRTGRMLDLAARSSELGSGWAAEDIGRLLLWLRVLAQTAPELTASAEAAVARLRLSRLVAGGTLHSVLNQNGREQTLNDQRLGRQQLTAAALAQWGVVLPQMLGYEHAVMREVAGLRAPADAREGGALSPDVFARGVIEIGGLDGCFDAAARAALLAQHELARQRRQPVMVADELLDRAPWFAYAALASGGLPWRVASFDQQAQPELANFSLKAAHLWAAVDTSAPTLAALALAESLDRSERGLYGGRYTNGALNAALTLDTNASVLLAAHYAQRGGQALLRIDNPIEASCPGLREPQGASRPPEKSS